MAAARSDGRGGRAQCSAVRGRAGAGQLDRRDRRSAAVSKSIRAAVPALVHSVSREALNRPSMRFTRRHHDDRHAARNGRRRAAGVGGRTVRLLGCAKGAGMIHPNMATMLCIHRDGRRHPAAGCSLALSAAVVPGTFNAVTCGRGYLDERYGAGSGRAARPANPPISRLGLAATAASWLRSRRCATPWLCRS
jgi:hypothetical protein